MKISIAAVLVVFGSSWCFASTINARDAALRAKGALTLASIQDDQEAIAIYDRGGCYYVGVADQISTSAGTPSQFEDAIGFCAPFGGPQKTREEAIQNLQKFISEQ